MSFGIGNPTKAPTVHSEEIKKNIKAFKKERPLTTELFAQMASEAKNNPKVSDIATTRINKMQSAKTKLDIMIEQTKLNLKNHKLSISDVPECEGLIHISHSFLTLLNKLHKLEGTEFSLRSRISNDSTYVAETSYDFDESNSVLDKVFKDHVNGLDDKLKEVAGETVIPKGTHIFKENIQMRFDDSNAVYRKFNNCLFNTNKNLDDISHNANKNGEKDIDEVFNEVHTAFQSSLKNIEDACKTPISKDQIRSENYSVRKNIDFSIEEKYKKISHDLKGKKSEDFTEFEIKSDKFKTAYENFKKIAQNPQTTDEYDKIFNQARAELHITYNEIK